MLEVIACAICVTAINLSFITFKFILDIKIKMLKNCEIFMIFKNINFINENVIILLNFHLFMLLTFSINV